MKYLVSLSILALVIAVVMSQTSPSPGNGTFPPPIPTGNGNGTFPPPIPTGTGNDTYPITTRNGTYPPRPLSTTETPMPDNPILEALFEFIKSIIEAILKYFGF